MDKVIVPSQVQFNEQDRIKEGTIRFLDEYSGRRVSQFTGPRGGRHYEVEGYQFDFQSVTGVTSIVNKWGLPDWYKRKGIEKAIDIMAQPGAQERLELQAKDKNARARKHKNHTWQTQLYDEAKVGPQDAMDIATEFGNDSHDIIEFLTMNSMGKNPDLLLINDALWSDYNGYMPIAEGFKAWLRDSNIELVASELMVYHPAYKYAGTIDLVGIKMSDPLSMVVIDIKTGGVFDEAAMQISAYAEALDYLTVPEWHVDDAIVLQLPRERPDKWDADQLYEVHKVKSIPTCHDAFLNAMSLKEGLSEETWIT